MRTIRELLKRAEKKIPGLDAQALLAHVLGRTREYLIVHDDAPIHLFAELRYRFLVNRRRRGVPVAYLAGHKEFFGLDFSVNRHTLIPRPETELIVELALEKIKNQGSRIKDLVLIDVGTGSGCIPIAILKNVQKKIKVIATDSSRKALRVAKRNAARHGVDITFLHEDLLPLLKNQEYIILTANLPYLTPKQYKEEPSIRHEPRSALVGGNTGLELYEKLLKQLQQLTTTYNLQATSYFEIDPSQSDAMMRLIHKYLPSASFEITKDLSGRDRVASIVQLLPLTGPQSKSARP